MSHNRNSSSREQHLTIVILQSAIYIRPGFQIEEGPSSTTCNTPSVLDVGQVDQDLCFWGCHRNGIFANAFRWRGREHLDQPTYWHPETTTCLGCFGFGVLKHTTKRVATCVKSVLQRETVLIPLDAPSPGNSPGMCAYNQV